jgi:two-component system response regulator MprA
MRVLIIEDDPAMAALLEKGLHEERHVVTVARDGSAGLELAENYQFDAVVLDWMLPGMDGLEVSRRLRRSGNATPILMLTARDAVPDIVKGLDAGTDDFLTKPFSFSELLARLRALARVHLTPTEYRLLEFLMRRQGAVASRRSIVEAVWGLEAEVEENTLDAFIRLLRSKVETAGKPRLIQTVRGFGYRLQEEPHE